ncbi:hypothetical protein HK102_008951, partial [Quaeritorhiza haematococci]
MARLTHKSSSSTILRSWSSLTTFLWILFSAPHAGASWRSPHSSPSMQPTQNSASFLSTSDFIRRAGSQNAAAAPLGGAGQSVPFGFMRTAPQLPKLVALRAPAMSVDVPFHQPTLFDNMMTSTYTTTTTTTTATASPCASDMTRTPFESSSTVTWSSGPAMQPVDFYTVREIIQKWDNELRLRNYMAAAAANGGRNVNVNVNSYTRSSTVVNGMGGAT